MNRLKELQIKYSSYITEKYSDYLKRNYIHFDIDRLEKESGALIIKNGARIIKDLEKYKDIQKDITEWRMLQGRKEFAETQQIKSYEGML